MPTVKRKLAKPQPEVVIPEKIYFRIGEVSELAKLPTYVLRFWETEFTLLKPTKSSTGQRMYRRKDVEYVMQIRKLLYEDGFTIAGAREKLREEMRPNPSQNSEATPALSTSSESPLRETQYSALQVIAPASGAPRREKLQKLRQQLCEVLDLLS